MKRITYPLPDNHLGIAEIEKDEVILYVEKVGSILWGLIDWPERVTHFEIFKLSDKDDHQPRSLLYERVIHGRIGRYEYNYRNIDTFNLCMELERMFKTYQENLSREQAWENRVNKFIKNTCK